MREEFAGNNPELVWRCPGKKNTPWYISRAFAALLLASIPHPWLATPQIRPMRQLLKDMGITVADQHIGPDDEPIEDVPIVVEESKRPSSKKRKRARDLPFDRWMEDSDEEFPESEAIPDSNDSPAKRRKRNYYRVRLCMY